MRSIPGCTEDFDSPERDTAKGARSDLLMELMKKPYLRGILAEVSGVKLKGFSNAEENMNEFFDTVTKDMLPIFVGINPWLDREIGKQMNRPIHNPTKKKVLS